MADHFLRDIQTYDEKQETGRLDIKNLNHPQQSWSLYLRLGRLFWLAGGKHEQRRIYRQLKNRYPQKINRLLALFPEVASTSEATYYNFLAYLLQKEYLTMEEFARIKQAIKLEVLFDLLQVYHIQSQASSDYGMSSGLQWKWSANARPEGYIPIPSEVATPTGILVKQAQKNWQNWREAGLTYCWPNQAPVMTQPEQIQQATAEKTFQNLKRLLTGQDSLRDIALATKRDILPVAKALWGYYKQGWLQFQEIPDRNWNQLTQPNQSQKTTAIASSENRKFLIACVDDSPQVTQTVEQIVRENGYDFIGINDPLRANATLLKVKPDLIFLDLIMPNTNGYEICTQLRRVSSLQEIPIIILTGQDGLIDRMRAKMVGATQYMSKPVYRSTILESVQKYLPNFTRQQTEINPDPSSAQA
ncbi:response regulator receiver protein [Halothece sp. PCC 7418]|uniref:response regulator n=1 Tax=Halothece sp. (strain PCC 7418) TaxID=65093 RepID=UPI0002A06D82|nr:response regulator [Halothece sp. PCC 7418]AFZ44966.1 response regulator receiver protein [Halothece sp. PCC 7418]